MVTTMTLEMTERRQLILKLVVQEYIDASQPVPSELLRQKYDLNFSSATIRNELAALEELGFLTHLHTSAGRLPTDAGYRYYVENLMDRTPLSATEQHTIRHQFYQVRSEFDQWIQLAGAVLARTAQNAAVVTPPRAYQSRFKHLELIAIHDLVVLLVLVLHDGTIRQQSLTTEISRSQEELSQLASQINQRCLDAPMARIDEVLQAERVQRPHASEDLDLQVLEVIIKTMRQHGDQLNQAIYSAGLVEILNQPEFLDADRARRVVGMLQSGTHFGPLITRVLSSNSVQVVIGGEHRQDTMREYSVVLSRYGAQGEVAGVLGIIGPTRMAYPRTISAVRYVSTVMSDLLQELYGERSSSNDSSD
jgi:heat-inducible transcriptional repressor